MDENKLRVLKDNAYVVQPTCSTCEAGQFANATVDFGTCALITYEHLKHTGDRRQLSINKNGWCPNYTRDAKSLGALGLWSPFCEDIAEQRLKAAYEAMDQKCWAEARQIIRQVGADIGDLSPLVIRVVTFFNCDRPDDVEGL